MKVERNGGSKDEREQKRDALHLFQVRGGIS